MEGYGNSGKAAKCLEHLTCDAHDLITVTDAHTALRSGDIVNIQPDRPFYFDATGAGIV